MSAPQELRTHFSAATQALQAGRIEEAIAGFESMADRGLAHPDASFNRGIAYLKRAHSPAAQLGDLGQAVAAFRETLALGRDDEAAQTLIDGSLLEIAARQSDARSAQITTAEPLYLQALKAVDPTLPLGFSVLGAILCLVALPFTLKAELKARALAVLILGGLLWTLGSAVYLMEDALVVRARYAVVVVPRAEPRDALARKLRGAQAFPEGTEVRVAKLQGNLVEVRGALEPVWLLSSDLRIVQSRQPSSP
jgi:tetratricopeptide (TPR) repeat protein